VVKLKKLMRRYIKSTEGTNLIEFAILAPVFLLMIIGLFDLGSLMIIQTSLDAGARQASRFGITGAGGVNRPALITQDVIDTISNYSGGIVNTKNLIITVSAYPDITNVSAGKGTVGSFGAGGQVVQYNITYQWKSFISSFGFPAFITLKANAVVQNESF
jgi:Flp pilus assembly protein TadG